MVVGPKQPRRIRPGISMLFWRWKNILKANYGRGGRSSDSTRRVVTADSLGGRRLPLSIPCLVSARPNGVEHPNRFNGAEHPSNAKQTFHKALMPSPCLSLFLRNGMSQLPSETRNIFRLPDSVSLPSVP